MTQHLPDIFNMFDYFLGARLEEGMGHRVAVRCDRGLTSYRDVFAWSGRWASEFTEAGLNPGDRVVLALDDGVDFVSAFFGILRAGAVVVMVNPGLGTDDVEYFLSYTGAAAAVLTPAAATTFHEAASALQPAPRMFILDEDARARLESVDPEFDTHRGSPDDPAIFLFSGGTTGRPKGVVQTHRSFVNTTELYGQRVLGFAPDDVTLSVPKLYFGYATGSNLLFPFSVGASTALFSERCTADALFARISEHRPSVLINVPTMVNHLLSHPEADRQDLSCLRLSTSAGEALPPELHRRWNDRWHVPLLDGLGTAEMWHIFISNRPDDVRPGTLGRPVAGFEVLACDDDGQPVAPGTVGRMRVRGASLALGYWKNDEATDAAFQNGWYLSGDMISMDDEGYVTYGGRADDMLKVGGIYVSPFEVEGALGSHPAVLEAAVVGHADDDRLIKPKADVVLKQIGRAHV